MEDKETTRELIESKSTRTLSSTSSIFEGLSDDESPDESSITSCLIGVENYLTITEGCKYALSIPQLTEAITKCKDLVLDTKECSEERKWLVRRLIELRYKLVQCKEAEEESRNGRKSNLEINVILGHHLELYYDPTIPYKQFCDRCCGSIWGVLQSWYQCLDCQYRCHEHCVIQTCRICPHLIISETCLYEPRICPEVGLGVQSFRCAECKAHVTFKNSWAEPRLCDYNGLYYCTSCHWNNSAIIPARVMKNWDFAPRFVCQASFQLLKLSKTRPLLTLNCKLYGLVEDLGQLKKLRHDILLMKSYLITCKEALEQKLIWKQFADRPHFLSDSDIFSLQDLIELKSGKLLINLETAVNIFSKHIKENCKVGLF
uniref:Phorbol-ester/DAG-type domain-containing protein n=1 Tax=Clastoptera arizonana TaxID=38151 RepID=A0A1B6CE20_9HEMI